MISFNLFRYRPLDSSPQKETFTSAQSNQWEKVRTKRWKKKTKRNRYVAISDELDFFFHEKKNENQKHIYVNLDWFWNVIGWWIDWRTALDWLKTIKEKTFNKFSARKRQGHIHFRNSTIRIQIKLTLGDQTIYSKIGCCWLSFSFLFLFCVHVSTKSEDMYTWMHFKPVAGVWCLEKSTGTGKA